MVKVIKNEDLPILELEIGDELKEEDYDIIRPALEEKIDKHGEVNCLVRMKEFPDFTTGAFLEDLRLALENYTDMNKIAIVGDDEKLENLSKAAVIFPGVKVENFRTKDLDAAWGWLKA